MNGNGGFVVTVVILLVTLVAAVKLTESGLVREPGGQPWTPWCRDCALADGPACPEHQPGPADCMSPEDWDALETLLADPQSLAEAAEQEARQSMNTTDEGTNS